MQEPSLLDILKLALTKQRVYRGGMFLLGAYLIGTGVLRFGSVSATEPGTFIRLILGAALLTAVRFVRATPGTVRAGHSAERAGSLTQAYEVTRSDQPGRLAAWEISDRLALVYSMVLAGSWLLRGTIAVASGGLVLMTVGLLLFLRTIRHEGIDVRWPAPAVSRGQPGETAVRWRRSLIALTLSVLTFFFLPENRLTLGCTALWIASVFAWLATSWEGPVRIGSDWRGFLLRLWRGEAGLCMTRPFLVFIVILVVAAVFRFAYLRAVPGEMTSDHVEDLLSVNRILNEGERPVFEAANGGRKRLTFYVAALTTRFAGAGLTHFTLKLVSALAGFLMLPFVYLLAREVTDDDIHGLLTMLITGVAWWPNVLGRLGLRVSFTVLFATIALWLMVRAVRRSQPDAALLSGLATGIGLCASTPMWVVPLATTLALLLAGLHSRQMTTVRRVIK